MALDAATLDLVAAELREKLLDAKIDKIFEPTRDEVLITLRTPYRDPPAAPVCPQRFGRVCLTAESFEKSAHPAGVLHAAAQTTSPGGRLSTCAGTGGPHRLFDFRCTNEMGDLVVNTLAAELMGRYSNLVLFRDGKIVDALKRVDFEDSEIRQLLPGLPYTLPPKPGKPDFLDVSGAAIVEAACRTDLPVAQALGKAVGGVGPVVLREAAWRAFGGETALAACDLNEEQRQALCAALEEIKAEHAAGAIPRRCGCPRRTAPSNRWNSASLRPGSMAPMPN